MLIKSLDSIVATLDLNLHQGSGERILSKIPLNQRMLCNPNCLDATLGTHKIWYLKGSRNICTRVPSKTSNTHLQNLHRYITNKSKQGKLEAWRILTYAKYSLPQASHCQHPAQIWESRKWNSIHFLLFLLFEQKIFGYGELPTDHTYTQHREGCQPIIVYQRACQ